MSAVEVLTTVREALGDPERWWRDEYWPNLEDGEYGDVAECACLLGACAIAQGWVFDPEPAPTPASLIAAVEETGIRKRLGLSDVFENDALVAEFNDDPSTTHADILNVLDRAIELAREGES